MVTIVININDNSSGFDIKTILVCVALCTKFEWRRPK